MKYIDMHMHLGMDHTDRQIADFVAGKRKEGLLKAVLIGPAERTAGGKAHERLLEVCRNHPGFFVPYARVDLSRPEKVDVEELCARGCVGLKFIEPYRDYDDECFFPVYAAAEKLGMPILFHTGVLGGGESPRGIRGVSTARMKPEFLDTIARAFPDLVLHGAHLGNPWYEVSLEIMRYNRNIYWDLCGTTLTKKMTAEWWTRIQWERESRRQFLYATDEYPLLPRDGAASHYTTGLEVHVQFLERIGWTGEEMEGYFYRNALSLLERAYARQGKTFECNA